MLCEYGCGIEATYQFKNGKWCCSKSSNQCKEIRIKNSKSCKSQERFKNPLLNPAYIKAKCEYCNRDISITGIKIHSKTCYLNPVNIKLCPICNEPIKDYKNNKTCSGKCGRQLFIDKYTEYGIKGNEIYYKNIPEEDRSYKYICFKYHEKKCIICGEELIVAVHHYDRNKDNNDPRNFIPICPTHHTYLHSNYSGLISKDVRLYHENFCKNFKVN